MLAGVRLAEPHRRRHPVPYRGAHIPRAHLSATRARRGRGSPWRVAAEALAQGGISGSGQENAVWIVVAVRSGSRRLPARSCRCPSRRAVCPRWRALPRAWEGRMRPSLTGRSRSRTAREAGVDRRAIAGWPDEEIADHPMSAGYAPVLTLDVVGASRRGRRPWPSVERRSRRAMREGSALCSAPTRSGRIPSETIRMTRCVEDEV